MYAAVAGQPTLLTPTDQASNQPARPTFAWNAVANAASYTLHVATDPTFTNLVLEESGIAEAQFSPDADLATNSRFYWRVQAVNPCGASTMSATFEFVTAAQPGDCDFTSTPVEHFFDDFEAAGIGWAHSGTEDTWALSGARVWSGSASFFARDVAIISDQRLVSPSIALPAGAAGLTLQFNTWQEIEGRTDGCYDGGILEVSTDDGFESGTTSAWSLVIP